jgi:hypothetical protein
LEAADREQLWAASRRALEAARPAEGTGFPGELFFPGSLMEIVELVDDADPAWQAAVRKGLASVAELAKQSAKDAGGEAGALLHVTVNRAEAARGEVRVMVEGVYVLRQPAKPTAQK